MKLTILGHECVNFIILLASLWVFECAYAQKSKIYYADPYGSYSVCEAAFETCRDAEVYLQRIQSNGFCAIDVDVPLELRSKVPNDQYYDAQWWAHRINLPAVWEYTTGGTTVLGDSVVVAIIDAGFDLTHPDLIGRYWTNWAELSGSDTSDNWLGDIHGWNFDNNSPVINVHPHGTQIAGIIGAAGNNQIGVSGVNWNVRILPVVGVTTTSRLVQALEYVKNKRDQYNASDGQRGAYVVAVSLSVGVTGGLPVNFPTICQKIDDLRESGVLVVAAGPNHAVDIDLVGDIPCTCPSDNLITTTGSDNADRLAPDMGFGKKNIDIAAPAMDIATTSVSGSYQLDVAGSSLTSPQVAGAIALLYTGPYQEADFRSLMRQQDAHLRFKSWILGGASKSEALKDKTSSGGRLDVAAAYELAAGHLNASQLPQKQIVAFPNPLLVGSPMWILLRGGRSDRLQVTWYNAAGISVHTERFELSEPVSEFYIRTLNLPMGAYAMRIIDLNDSFAPISIPISVM